MTTLPYKIESSSPIVASLPRTNVRDGARLASRELAVSLAAKSITDPPGGWCVWFMCPPARFCSARSVGGVS